LNELVRNRGGGPRGAKRRNDRQSAPRRPQNRLHRTYCMKQFRINPMQSFAVSDWRTAPCVETRIASGPGDCRDGSAAIAEARRRDSDRSQQARRLHPGHRRRGRRLSQPSIPPPALPARARLRSDERELLSKRLAPENRGAGVNSVTDWSLLQQAHYLPAVTTLACLALPGRSAPCQ
jgi:hypothetical protein